MREQQTVSIDSDCSRCGGSGLCTGDSPGIQYVCICVRFEKFQSNVKPLTEVAADVVASGLDEAIAERRLAKAFERVATDLEPMGHGLLAQEAWRGRCQQAEEKLHLAAASLAAIANADPRLRMDRAAIAVEVRVDRMNWNRLCILLDALLDEEE